MQKYSILPLLLTAIIVTGMESSESWAKMLTATEPQSGIKWAPVLDSYINSPSDHYIYVQNKQMQNFQV